jgi:hypothetical protein
MRGICLDVCDHILVVQDTNVCRKDRLVVTNVNKRMTPFRGQASLAKMTSPGGKLWAEACHLTPIFLQISISYNLFMNKIAYSQCYMVEIKKHKKF